MKRLSLFLRATIMLSAVGAGVFATVYNPAPAAAQEDRKCYWCECTSSGCYCVEIMCP
jgi:hypothetical protein